MKPTRSRRRESGLTLVEMIMVVLLGVVVVLGAGEVYRGVIRSANMSARKATITQGATQLSRVISRRVRVASGFTVYQIPNRTIPSAVGDGLALLDADGEVIDRLEWNTEFSTLADSNGARVTPMTIGSLQFATDLASPRTVRFRYRTTDGMNELVDIESAASVRN